MSVENAVYIMQLETELAALKDIYTETLTGEYGHTLEESKVLMDEQIKRRIAKATRKESV